MKECQFLNCEFCTIYAHVYVSHFCSCWLLWLHCSFQTSNYTHFTTFLSV